jgi:predicted extracellular nuclease
VIFISLSENIFKFKKSGPNMKPKQHILVVISTLFFTTMTNASVQHNPLKGVSNLVINEFLADPATDITGDANGDGTRSSSADEFVEIYNHSDNSQDISGWTLTDSSQVRHTFPANTIVPGRCSIVVFGGGSPTGAFGFSEVQTASTGGVSFNNGGDTISLMSGPTTVTSYTYDSSAGAANQSLTRDPIATGIFIEHDTATDANGALFSPGTNPDGSYFTGCPIGDLPPTVATTIPADKAGGVAVSDSITINFSENVDLASGAFTLNCGAGDLSFSGLPVIDTNSVVLTPDANLPNEELCTVTAVAANITDADEGNFQLDGNGDTAGGDNYIWTFIVGNPSFEIWEIQGNSIASPYDGYTIDSNDNIITALDTNGIYIQTPDARSDGDANTSDGLFVYTGADPVGTYAVGDQVDVSGKMIEFFGTTEFTLPNTIVIDSSGNALPTPVLLDDNFPPNDPTVAPCSTDPATHKYECVEGMPFNMPQGFISSGYAGGSFFAGANAEDVLVRAGTHRAFREPGIDHPGLPNLPVYDGNPEILEMDFDGLGVYDMNTFDFSAFAGGTEISAKGIFGFEFDEYEIWPSEIITVINENVIPAAVRNALDTEVTVGSANLFRFFDDVNDVYPEDDDTIPTTQEFQARVTKFSKYIVNDLKAPMILALQEVENLNALNVLIASTEFSNAGISYTPYLIDGEDPGGINVAYLVRDNVTPVNAPVQLGTDETQSSNGFNLHDRPPFYLEADVTLAVGTMRVHVLGIHNRSRGSIESSSPSEATRVREKRLEQANSVAVMIKDIQDNNPGEPIITLGDFNAFHFTDGYADVIGQITGTAIEADNLHWTDPLFASAPLTQAVQTLADAQQYSYVFQGSAQFLDNAILNDEALTMMNEIQFSRGQSDANLSFQDDTSSLRTTDHDGFVLFLTKDFDLIFSNGFE